MTSAIVYLHGFNSSPQSFKAAQTRDYFSWHFPELQIVIPQMPFDPQVALSMARAAIPVNSAPAFIGSSMGGFYANILAEELSARAVLINPAVRPYELLRDYLGLQVNDTTGEKFTLEERHMLELQRMDTGVPSEPHKRLLLTQTADETLDFLDAASQFHASPAIIEYGGNHSFEGYERWLPRIADFLFYQ